MKKGLVKKFMRAYYGFDTWREFWLLRWERIARLWGDRTEYYDIEHARRLREEFITEFTTDNCIKIKDVKLPLLDKEHENLFFQQYFLGYFYVILLF